MGRELDQRLGDDAATHEELLRLPEELRHPVGELPGLTDRGREDHEAEPGQHAEDDQVDGQGGEPAVDLFGATAGAGCAAPVGSSLVSVNAGPDNALTPGESANARLQFMNPTNAAINYSPRVVAGEGTR